MRTVLEQRRFEFREQLLGNFARISAVPQPGDDLHLARHMSFALRDMVINHSKIGRSVSHPRNIRPS